MQTTIRSGGWPGERWINHGAMPLACVEVEYRTQRLLAQADAERLVGRRDGLRQRLGHALIALGRTIHGVELEPARRAST
jgi:hypothetical protein